MKSVQRLLQLDALSTLFVPLHHMLVVHNIVVYHIQASGH